MWMPKQPAILSVHAAGRHLQGRKIDLAYVRNLWQVFHSSP